MKYKGILAQEIETKGLGVANPQPCIVTFPHKVLLEIRLETEEDWQMIEMLILGKWDKNLKMKYKGNLAQEFETKELAVTSIHASKQILIIMQPTQISQGDHRVVTAIFHDRDLIHHLLGREKD